MGLGDSFSKVLGKLKHPVAKGRRKLERKESSSTAEKVDLASPVTRPEPHVVAGGKHDREGNGIGVEGTQNNLCPDIEVEVERSPSREENNVDGEKIDQVDPPTFTPSITHNGEPDGNSETSSPPANLRLDSSLPPGGVVASPDTVPDHVQGAPTSDQSETNAADQNKPDLWKSTSHATTNLFLCGMKELADAPGPLKDVVAGLCFILENSEQNKADKQAIESLASRVKAFSTSTCTPVSEGDDKEEARRKEAERKLESVLRQLEPLADRGSVEGFFNDVKNADKLGGLAGEIYDAVVAYFISLQQDSCDKGCRLIESTDLTLLNKIHHAADAGYHHGSRQGCLRGTRNEILSQIDRWLTDKKDRRVFWLNGLAGTGKSTISQTLAETSFADGKLGASFFCSRDFEDRSDLQQIFPTLAFQLAHRYPPFRRELLQALGTSPDVRRESLCSQMEKFIVGPLKAARISTLIIIDAIDECKNEEPASAILSILSRYVHEIPGVKFFITGRPEPRIHSGFRLATLRPITEVLSLHDIEHPSVNDDIKLFLRTRLNGIIKTRTNCDFPEEWPTSTDIDTLSRKAAGFFIHASTVVKFIESETHLPTTRLSLITSIPQSSVEGEPDTDVLFTQILEQAFSSVDIEDEEFHRHLRSVVAAVLLVFNPLPPKTLFTLLEAPDISTALYSLHPLLLGPKIEADPIRVFHKLFSDFLTNSGRCKDERFFINPSVHHQEILLSCLRLMKERLKKNICDLDNNVSLNKVNDLPARRKMYIGDALEYACRFWTRHLVEIPSNSHNIGEVHRAIDGFFTAQLPYWIEVLSLIGSSDISVSAINDVHKWYMVAGVVCKWTDDSQRLLLESLSTIHNSPSKIYQHTLSFCPSSSWLHVNYTPRLLQEVKVVKGLPVRWNACSHTLSFHHFPQSLTCWKDVVAVGSISGDISILDVIPGTCTSTLSRHTDSVEALTFSLDGALLVSGSNDKTINLWDTQTGGVVRTFHGHTDWVWSVSISPDCAKIASGSGDTTIRVWDLWTGECHQIIRGHNSYITSVGFSLTNSQLLISASVDGTVLQWDVEGNQIGPAYPGYGVSLSLDGALFISWDQEVATARSTDSGTIVAELHVANSIFQRCCFSPDGRFVACAAGEIIYVWDITNLDSCLIETFAGHTKDITSLAFSSPSLLISASDDKSVKFWQITTSSKDPVPSDPEPTPLTSVSIKSVALQTKDGIAISSDSDGVVKVWDIFTGLCKGSFHTPADANNWRDVGLVDGRLIVSWLTDEGIWIWDAERSELLQKVDTSFNHPLSGFRISGDGSKVFCVDENSLQAWLIQTGEGVGEVKLEHRPYLHSLIVDGSKVWVHFKDSPIQGWDFGTSGSSPTLLSDTPPDRPPLDFIDSTKGWNKSPSRVENTVTGEKIFQLPERYAEPLVSQWDGQYLVAGYENGEVMILDFNHMLPE